MANNKEKRLSIRVPILSGNIELRTPDLKTNSLKLHDISNTGCFVETTEFLRPKDKVDVLLHLPGDLGVLVVLAEVQWIRWAVKKGAKDQPLGMGLKFSTSVPQQKILDAFVVYLRNKQIITVSKRIIEEFFGDNPPIQPK